MINTKNLSNGTLVSINEDTKFYETLISFKILFPLEKKTNTLGNLLTHMLADRTLTHDTKRSINAYLDTLYGVKLSSYTYSLGNTQVIDVSVRSIKDTLASRPILNEVAKLVKEIVTEPLINEATLKEAKNAMRQQLHYLEDDPNIHSVVLAFEKGTKDSTIAVSTYGDLDDLDNIDVKSIKDFHHKVVNEFNKQVYVVGTVETLDLEIFNFGNSHPSSTAMTTTDVIEGELVQSFDTGQTCLVNLYQTNILPIDKLYPAYSVFIAILGQLPNSLLFQNIREKESLCYSIYASKENFNGLFYIATSISGENIEQTKALIKEQFEIIRKGDFEVNSAITYLTTQIKGLTQQINGVISHEFRNSLTGQTVTLDQLANDISTVTKEEVIQVLDTISHTFTYVYKGEQQ